MQTAKTLNQTGRMPMHIRVFAGLQVTVGFVMLQLIYCFHTKQDTLGHSVRQEASMNYTAAVSIFPQNASQLSYVL